VCMVYMVCIVDEETGVYGVLYGVYGVYAPYKVFMACMACVTCMASMKKMACTACICRTCRVWRVYFQMWLCDQNPCSKIQCLLEISEKLPLNVSITMG
jgi:hypothetical protein